MAKAAASVVALTSGYFGLDGVSVLVTEGEEFRADHPLVKKYPAHFTKDTAAHVVVEQATAAPGEKRGA
jgi:hypothetical protein